jgi:hypothetical protein
MYEMRTIKKILKKLDPNWVEVPDSLKGMPRKRVYSIAYATGGMLTRGNVDALYYALKETRNIEGCLLEIGSFCGLSSNVITFLKRHLGVERPLFAIDPWNLVNLDEMEEDRTEIELGIPDSELSEFIREAYRTRVRFFSRSDLPNAIQGFSHDVFAKWEKGETVKDLFDRDVTLGGPIAFAYIDGDHSYEGAKQDFHNVDRYLSTGGMILFDDSGDRDDRGCAVAAREAAGRPNYQLVSKNPNYLIRKLKP